MSPAEREARILDALTILPAVARRTGVAGIRSPVADLDDYLQVGAVAICEAVRRYDPQRGAAFATYAWKAAHDAMYDEARRLRWRHQARQRSDRILWSLDVPAPVSVAGDEHGLRFDEFLFDPDAELPGDMLETAETRQALHDAVQQLPPRQQEAVRLHYFDGLDQYQIADRLGITQPAVSLRLRYARRNLARLLAAKGVAA